MRGWGGCEWSILLRPWEDGGVLQVKARRGSCMADNGKSGGEEGVFDWFWGSKG